MSAEMPPRIWAHEPSGLYYESAADFMPMTEFVRADIADGLVEALKRLVDAKAISGIRQVVAGWNGENRPEGPYKERHPPSLGATLPKTNCGAVYELDDAMQAARAAIARVEAGR